MKNAGQETHSIPPSLLDDAQHLHPNLRFCGDPTNAILSFSDDLLNYVLSLLKDDPVLPPQVSLTEWRGLLSTLKSHWVLPLLYWHVGRLPDEFRPPEPVADTMRATFQWSRARCFHMERQLGEIVAAFKDEGVRILVLKGPALGRTVYPDPVLRPASDLDLLVRPDEFMKAREIFEKIGYQCKSKIFEVFKDFHREEEFISRTNSRVIRCVDVHWDLHQFFGEKRGNKVEVIFQNAIEVEAANLSFETMHPVDALINAALHLIMHHNQDMRLIWVYDIALLARSLVVPEDWEMLQEKSSEWGARLAVEESLRLAQILTDLQLPKRFDNFSTWPKPAMAELACLNNAMVKGENTKTLFELLKELYLSSSAKNFKKILYIFKLIFPDPGYMRHWYPQSNGLLLPLSYARRWWKWVKKPTS